MSATGECICTALVTVTVYSDQLWEDYDIKPPIGWKSEYFILWETERNHERIDFKL